MSIRKYLNRLKRMDDLIRRKATGTPDEFSDRLGISKSMLMVNLAELRELGAPVKFDGREKTYYYERPCRLFLEFVVDEPELNAVTGGSNIFAEFFPL